MKKLIFAVMAVMVMAAPMANAQKVNKDATLAKLAKADADVADAKKGSKAATWINRGKAYYTAASAPTKDIFVDMPQADLELVLGKADATNEGVQLGDGAYTELVYPWLKIYMADGKIATWVLTQTVKDEDLAAVALDSYNKAYEMDNKSASKLGDLLKQLENYYSQNGNVYMKAAKYVDAAHAYAQAYKVQESPAFAGVKDPSYLYYAGYLYTIDGATNNASYVKGAEMLSKALEAGYTDPDGNIYYYLYHCYYGQTDSSVRLANLQRAKDLLMEGLAKFPKNDRIVEGLINVYTSDSQVGDPTELIKMVDGALERDPKNKDMWFGRGRIFYSMKNYDESIASFKKVVELDPNDAQSTYFLGYFYIAKGDALNDEINKRDYKSMAAYNEDQKGVNAIYMEAIPYLEKAYELNPNDFATVETLKVLCFRLRDEAGVMEKYEKYNKIYEEMNAKRQQQK